MTNIVRVTRVIAVLATVLWAGCGKRVGPDDIVLQDPVRAVADARAVIAETEKNPASYKDWVAPDALPASLRIPGLQCAVVHKDHVDLLLTRIPDWWVGARIWSANSTTAHADKPTRYKDVYFFTYSNDFPDSPENMR